MVLFLPKRACSSDPSIHSKLLCKEPSLPSAWARSSQRQLVLRVAFWVFPIQTQIHGLHNHKHRRLFTTSCHLLLSLLHREKYLPYQLLGFLCQLCSTCTECNLSRITTLAAHQRSEATGHQINQLHCQVQRKLEEDPWRCHLWRTSHCWSKVTQSNIRVCISIVKWN